MTNETIDDIVREMRDTPTAMFDTIRNWTDRIEAAVERITASEGAHGDCVKCIDDPDWNCPWCGEPNGCNNRELGERIRKESEAKK